MGKKIDRREFLKMIGAGAAASSVSCINNATPTQTPSESEATTGEMTRKAVAGVDKEISVLGYGCMRWPTLEGVPKGENIVDQEAVNKLVAHAITNGINYFDTAPMYCQGWSEEATGTALVPYPRDSYYLSTKLSNKGDHSFKFAHEMYLRSFKRLRTDHIDYYFLHNVGVSMEDFNGRFIENGMLDFLLEERKAGRIRHLGWSFHGDKEVFDYILSMHEKVHWDFVMIQLNYSDWRHARKTFANNVNAEYLYGELEKRSIPISVMEPLLGGRLANMPDHVVSYLKEREPNNSVASWAFRFAGSKPQVYVVLSGMTKMEHLEENIKTFSPLKRLTTEENEFLDKTAEMLIKYPTIPCNNCDYCMPCPYGIDIPGTLLYYNKCINEGNISKSTMDENYQKARRAYLIGYDRAVPKQRQAQRCIGCDQCIKHCPQKINIPEELRRIDEYVEKLKQETL